MSSTHVFRTQFQKKNKKKTVDDFSRFETAQETMNTGNLLAAQKLTSMNNTKKRQCLCSATQPARERWDYFVMIIATWNALSLPIELAFEPEFTKSQENATANGIIDLLFLIDIIVVFRTSIIGDNGEIVYDQKTIAIKYLKGSFMIDFLSTIPLDSMAGIFLDEATAEQFKLFGCLKLIRVIRLNRIIRDMNAQSHIKVVLKLIKLTFFLLLYVHLQSCLWYAIVKQEALWIPPLNTIYEWQSISIFNESLFYQYWVCTYTSCLYLMGNDLMPRGVAQIAVGTFFNGFGAIILANLFGELAVLVRELNARNITLQKKMTSAKTAMLTIGIPIEQQNLIQAFISSSDDSLYFQKQLNRFLNNLTPSLQASITKNLFQILCKESKLFSKPLKSDLVLQRELQFIGAMSQPLQKLPEDIVISQGGTTTALYFLSKGQCRVTCTDFAGRKNDVCKLKPGAVFGEISYLLKCRRTATVRCIDYASILYLPRIEGYRFKHLSALLKDQFMKYQDKGHQVTRQILQQSIDFLQEKDPRLKASNELLRQIGYSMQHQQFNKDEVILFEGEPLKGIYLVRSGIINVKMRSSLFQEYNIQRLYPGCSYGTYAFFVDEESSSRLSKYTLQAVSPGDFFFIRYNLLNLLGQYDNTLKHIIEHYHRKVRLNGIPLCDFKVYRKERDLREIFVQALRRLILLNKQRRSQIQILKKINGQISDSEDKSNNRKTTSMDLVAIENAIFQRMQEKDVISNFDMARLRLKLLDDELQKVYDTVKGRSTDAHKQKQKVFKALTRI